MISVTSSSSAVASRHQNRHETVAVPSPGHRKHGKPDIDKRRCSPRHVATNVTIPPGFVTHELDESYKLHAGSLPNDLLLSQDHFESIWKLHPKKFHVVKIGGRLSKTPRWQQAYGVDYHYSGLTNRAIPVPDILSHLLTWGREAIYDRLNGICTF